MESRPSPPCHIVLCMIVKNEAAVIERCLASVLPHVDGFVICDTGSSDTTVPCIEKMAERGGVPGKVARHEWKSFGHNRTLAAAEARAWVESRCWPLDRTYLLLLDADMVLRVEPGFDRTALVATDIQLRQTDGTLHYYNTRLARLSRVWVSVGVTHEYWKAEDGPIDGQRLESMWIEDVGDGGCKSDKFERDIRLLSGALSSDEPDNTRYMFYLAQSLYDVRRFQEAYTWYDRRRAAGGWDEERWYAHYRQGLCLLRLGEDERAAGVLLEAFEERPARAEPLHALARHYRERGSNHLALMFALRGLEVPYPEGDTLFVAKPVYDWQLWEEVMISAFYAGGRYHSMGLDACERLLARRGHPSEHYDYVARNESFYLPVLEGGRRGTFCVSDELRSLYDIEWACSNPTVVSWRGATYVNLRMVNYRQDRGMSYIAPADGIIRTRNVSLRWEPQDARIVWERQSSVGAHISWPSDLRVHGLEDMRWFVFRDRVWFTANTWQQIDGKTVVCVVLGRMSEALDTTDHLVKLTCDGMQDCEKNWIPWPRGDALCLIYSYDPTVILAVAPETGRTVRAAVSQPPWEARRLRGSTSPVPIPGREGRWLLLVHEAVQLTSERVYCHRWVEMDASGALVARSRPFTFDHRGIEYAAGICCRGNDRLIVTYGFEDREARWIELEWAAVLRMLQPTSGDDSLADR